MRIFFVKMAFILACIIITSNYFVNLIQAQEQVASNENVVSLYRAGLLGKDNLPEDQCLAMAVYALHRSEKFPETAAAMWEVTKEYLQQNESQSTNIRLQIVELFFSTIENMLANIDSETVFTNAWNVRKNVLEERNQLAEILHAEGEKLLETNENAIIQWVITPSSTDKENDLEKTELKNLKTVFEIISVLDTVECAATSAQEYQQQLDTLRKKIISAFKNEIDQLYAVQKSQVDELKAADKIIAVIPQKKDGEWTKGKATILLENVQTLNELIGDSFIEDHLHLSDMEEFTNLCQHLTELTEKVRLLQILRYNAWAIDCIQDATSLMHIVNISPEYLYPLVATIYGEKQAELVALEERAVERRRIFIMRQISAEKVPLTAF